MFASRYCLYVTKNVITEETMSATLREVHGASFNDSESDGVGKADRPVYV